MQGMVRTIFQEINLLCQTKQRIIIGIDGRCGAGKTTFAAFLQKVYECNVVHMDHFFLRPIQRQMERTNEAGGNIDWDRLLKEVIHPLEQGKTFNYRPYDCKKQQFLDSIQLNPKKLTIIEGSYSCHPKLVEEYDLKFFNTVSEKEQLRRIKSRNGEQAAQIFKEKWIPLEEFYFSTYNIEKNCEIYFNSEMYTNMGLNPASRE